MKTLVLIIVSLFLLIELSAQNVCASNQLATQAEIHYRQKTNLPKAVELYKSAFQLNLTDGSKVLDALNAATSILDTSSVIEFMSNCMSIGIEPSTIKDLWPRMGNGMDFENLISSIDTIAIMNHYYSTLDTALIKKLHQLADNDQKYRGEDDSYWNRQRSLDSLNWKELKKIVQSIGRLPKFKELGSEGQENLEILFFHMDKDIIEWFLPYIIQCSNEDNSILGRVVLYQLDRIGMSDGLIYTITEDYNLEVNSKRTKLKNGYYCQSFGEWFYEKSRLDKKLYETPIDPTIDLKEVNRVRSLFCLSSIDQKRLTQPWVNIVSISEFENKIKE